MLVRGQPSDKAGALLGSRDVRAAASGGGGVPLSVGRRGRAANVVCVVDTRQRAANVGASSRRRVLRVECWAVASVGGVNCRRAATQHVAAGSVVGNDAIGRAALVAGATRVGTMVALRPPSVGGQQKRPAEKVTVCDGGQQSSLSVFCAVCSTPQQQRSLASLA
jgi:hypothetical protein